MEKLNGGDEPKVFALGTGSGHQIARSSHRQKECDGVFSTLDAFIRTINLVNDTSVIPPAQEAPLALP